MQIMTNLKKTRSLVCALWIALCFTLTSSVYLSWVYRLVELAGSKATDWLSMVFGYLFQAGGMLLTGILLKRNPEGDHRRIFCITVFLFALVSMPALITMYPLAAAIFGFLMNLLCGVMSGYYLYSLAVISGGRHMGLSFGGGYALSTVIVFLFSLVGSGGFLRNRVALPVYLILCVLTVGMIYYFPLLEVPETSGAGKNKATPDAGGGAANNSAAKGPDMQNAHGAAVTDIPAAGSGRKNAHGAAVTNPGLQDRTLLLACVVVVMLSLVKNLGFSFPSSDIQTGIRPELSRVFYAVGLCTAGFIIDKKRQDGVICTLAALVIPFIMLAVSGEPVSTTICWGLDYLFYGFFSVFRAVLLLDIALRLGRMYLAPAGLLIGRLGDAAGTAICLVLSENRIALIFLTAILFSVTVFLLGRLSLRIFAPQIRHRRSEREAFESFSARYDLSPREREVLRLIIAEKSNSEIAETLYVTESTIKYHVHNLLKKTGCRTRVELIGAYAALLEPDEGPHT